MVHWCNSLIPLVEVSPVLCTRHHGAPHTSHHLHVVGRVEAHTVIIPPLALALLILLLQLLMIFKEIPLHGF